jgi:hypothetical protein
MNEDEARTERDRRLSATDWTQTPDAPLTENEKARYRGYRQALRDVPNQSEFPAAIEWPTVPERDPIIEPMASIL